MPELDNHASNHGYELFTLLRIPIPDVKRFLSKLTSPHEQSISVTNYESVNWKTAITSDRD